MAAAALFLFILIAGNALVGLTGAQKALLGNDLIGILGVVLFLISAVSGAAFLKVAGSVAAGEKWARTAGLGLGILMLPVVPIGTALGFIVMRGLIGREARSWFSPTGPRE